MSRCSSFSYFVFLFAWLLGTTAGLTKPSSVKLEDNGYTGVVIAIHHKEKESPDLIKSLIYMVNNASSYLYKATKQRAYFKEVMILIPDTWADNSMYTASPRNATFEDADIIVAPRNYRFAPPSSVAVPHTIHYEGCGKQSLHIHLPRSFLLNPFFDSDGQKISSKGKGLVREWGHYRWGLFNEYADEITDGDDAKYFYRSDEGKYRPTRCSRNWDVRIKNRLPSGSCILDEKNGYETGCVNVPTPKQTKATASIMSWETSEYVDGIVDFCDDDVESSELHDSLAPNKHNDLCNYRSNWAVMRDHPDFKGENNLPRSISDVTPNITLARLKPIRVVLVLDSSGSMASLDRISKLASSARSFITSTAVNGSYIGIVDFDTTGKELSELTLINSDQTRRRLSTLVPTEAKGGTCIGCGLEKALEILSENEASPSGGRILLITDGQDGNDARTENMKNRCVEESVIVDCVAFSDVPDNLVNLAKATGGKLFLQTDDPTSTGLHEAFLVTMESGVKEYDRKIVLFLDSGRYQLNESRSHSVYVDETVGRKTSFGFTYLVNSSSPAVDVTITSPSGNFYNSSYEGYKHDPTFKTASVEFESAEPGLWSYMVSNTHNTDDTISVTVSTYPSKEDVDPIIATAELSGSITDFANGESLSAFAEVKQGFNPIIGAKVIATIVRPPDALGIAYPPIDLELRDNGAGVDVTKDDGIYSRSFTNFTGVGYYGIKINVNNDDGTAIIVGPNTTASYLRNSNDAKPEEYLKETDISKRGKRAVLHSAMSAYGLTGKPAPKFTRGISGGSSRVPKTPPNWKPGDDVMAPCKIPDLRVTSSSYQNATVTLQFTASGDDLDNGRADYYVLRKSSNAIDLRSNYTSLPTINETDILHGDIFSPGEFGDLEVFVIQVPIPRNQSIVSYTFAVHAVDDSGNEGMTSNLAQAVLREPIPQAPTTDSPTTILDNTTPAASPYEYDPKGWTVVLKVVFIAAGSLLAVVLLLVLGWHKLTQSSKKKKYGVQDVIVHSNKQPVPHENIAYKVEV